MLFIYSIKKITIKKYYKNNKLKVNLYSQKTIKLSIFILFKIIE